MDQKKTARSNFNPVCFFNPIFFGQKGADRKVFGALINFCKIDLFFATPSMIYETYKQRRGKNRKKSRKKKKILQSGICPVLCVLCVFTVVFSVCARIGNAAYTIFIMCNYISSLDTWYNSGLTSVVVSVST